MPASIRLGSLLQALSGAAGWVCLVVVNCFGATESPSVAGLEFFERRIRPILVDHCYKCHSSAGKLKGGLNLETRDGLLRGGDTGPALEPGSPDQSRLIEAVRYKNQDLQMPPKSPLSGEQIQDLEKWVAMGAPDPRTPVAQVSSNKRVIDLVEGHKFWAFQPMAHPAPPAVVRTDWVQSPVDAFILAKLEENHLAPAPPADRWALIRRATFDLTGLPPTPEDVEGFLKDASPGAFARVVDRLLASPHYGERWGRHWLDVARYADSNGLDENVAFGNAWRYRDYVINAFYHNKSYDQFVTEQLAGDLLPATEILAVQHERLTALGFLTIGPKVLAEPDKVKLEMDLIDEQIDTLGRTFLATTLGCARCHDHKFDPIPTDDYYALAAIFKSTHTMDDLKTPATWHEPEIARPEDRQAQEAFQQRLLAQRLGLTNRMAEANRVVLLSLKTNNLPASPEKFYPTNTVAELETFRAALKKVEGEAPEMPTTMGVKDRAQLLKELPVHLRGSHLTLGHPVSRGVPQVMTDAQARPAFNEQQSGRLELARWLVNPEHPLTSRVLVNRIWHWHFGQGIVPSTDNFGLLGNRPSHPELLDWLARRFVVGGWDIKAMHRLLMLSSTYQMAAISEAALPTADPENRLLHSFPMRRLDAEEIRDALLAVSADLDRSLGGKTIPLKNREYVFDHTSKDATTYDLPRRSVYLPIIRNHLYDLFQQFDFPDPAVPNGSRNVTVVAPQALLMMNSKLVQQTADHWATRILTDTHATDSQHLDQAYLQAYGRPPNLREKQRAEVFLNSFASTLSGLDPTSARHAAWTTFCQSLLAANEFIYLH